jgi:fatty-acid desaturase
MWYNGLLDLSVMQLVLVALGLTHVTIISVTLYLHRHSAHNTLDLHPVLAHFFRFWLWLTTATNTKEWTAIHRKHHAKCETEDDPHSPVVLGIRKVLFQGAELYEEAATEETVNRYGQRTPEDWVERKVYSRYKMLGIQLMAVIDLMLFGVNGIWIWALQMMWIPVWAAGVVNGIGHFMGYRNFECADNARNISPLGLLIGGEELYNELVEPYGVHLIGAAATGLESFVSKKPLRTVADLQGLKMRAPEGMVYNIFQKAGATPVNLPGSEVYTALEKGVIDAADYTVFSTNQDQGLHSFARYPNYPGFHSLPMVAVSLNKEIWDGLPEDLQTILEVSVDSMAYEMVALLKARDLVAVNAARLDENIEIIDMAPEERAKFRNIAKSEWVVWADKSEMNQKIYDSVVEYLIDRNLM